MDRDHLRAVSLVVVSAVVGWIAWSGVPLLLPVSLLFPVLWSAASSRNMAIMVSGGYFLAASRGLPFGVAAFYQSDIWPGLLLWFCASFSFVAVHGALWTLNVRVRAFRYLAAGLLMALPPLGITGWAHPITAASVLFPGTGWWGLVGTAAGLAMLTTRKWPAAALALSGLWLWSAATWTPLTVTDRWHGVDTTRGASLGRDASLSRQRDLIATARSAASTGAQTVVLPESALGYWTPSIERVWRKGLEGTNAIVVGGAALLDRDGYDNIMVAISSAGSEVIYHQRMPIPVSMWQPWRQWVGGDGAARARFFANPIVDLNGQPIALLICYEQLIVWPVLQSMLHDPEIIVAVGNGWWTVGTSIVDIQHASVGAWARLFAKSVVFSFNT
jgi:hypothetical protein